MPIYILYLLKLSISMGIVWLFYQLLLRRLTFYNWNRWYLLVYSLLSFVIPLVEIRLFVKEGPMGEPAFVSEIPVILNVAVSHPAPVLTAWDIVSGIMIAGALVLLIRMFLRVISLQKLRSKATPIDGGGKFFVYDVNKPIIPFSFGRAIYINPRLHSKEEWKQIILHEYIHVRQQHTIDIILSELLCIVNWYNPFAWLIRFSIRQNLEFIADDHVIGNGSDKTEYQYHLLKVVGVAEYRIANSFNFSSLRKRIIMMNKSKSARLNLVRFLFIFPLLAVLLLAFRNKYTAMVAEKHMEAAISMDKAMKTDDPKPGSSDPVAENGTEEKNRSSGISARNPFGNIVLRSGDILGRDTLRPEDSIRSAFADSLVRSFTPDMFYVVDGMQMPPGWSFRYLDQSSIQQISVLKGPDAIRKYGPRASNGVVTLTTRLAGDSLTTGATHMVGNPLISGETRIHLHNPAAKQPLYIVDGVEVDSAQFSKIPPAEIQSIMVLKGEEADKAYGREKAKNGVLVITLKKAAGAASGKASSISLQFDSKSHKPNPLFVVNGQQMDSAQVMKIPPGSIDSLVVVFGNDATQRYGDKGRNGVMQIHLKTPTTLLNP